MITLLVVTLVLSALALLIARKPIVSATLGLLGGFITYASVPVIRLDNTAFWWLVSIFLIATIVAGFIFNEKEPPGAYATIVASVILIVLVIGYGIFSTSSIIHHKSYRALIGEVKTSTFSTDTTPIDPAHVRIIDHNYARQLAQKRLGEDTALGSLVVLGELHIQKVKNDLYWIGPLNHSGFWKWLLSDGGTRGYVMVSATDERDVKLVETVNDKKLKIRFNEGGWFGDEMDRYLWFNGYQSTYRSDYVFEIDDEGNPFWTITVAENTIGFEGKNATGVLVFDAQTGDIKQYGINDAPVWVDRIQPDDFIQDQITNWGEYINGWLNPQHIDIINPTPGIQVVYGHDGVCYWYLGMKTTGSEHGTVGFVLVNARTKEARFYKQSGATEIDAMYSAQGAVQEKRYMATSPVLYNVSGLPTYFMTLKDGAGLVKAMAFVSVENYQIVGIGENVHTALLAYRRNLASRGNSLLTESIVHSQKVSGPISRLSRDDKAGNSYFYFLIGGHESVLFVGTSDVSMEIPISKEGDVVSIEYNDGGENTVEIQRFDNTAITLQSTAVSRKVEARADNVRASDTEKRGAQNATAEWERLTPAQKAELLKGVKK